MFIETLTLHNFKSFSGDHTVSFKPGVNFLVGNNNSGKSSILEGIRFLRDGGHSDLPDLITNGEDEMFVEAVFSFDSPAEINEDFRKKCGPYIESDDSGRTHIWARRQSYTGTVTQGPEGKTKEKTVDDKTILLYDWSTKSFGNPTGIPSLFQKLFDPTFVWATTSPDDVVDFSGTKILGKLINASAQEFFSGSKWGTFVKAHAETFSASDGLASQLDTLSREITGRVTSQYGDDHIQIHIDFAPPEPAQMTKSGTLMVQESGSCDSPLDLKGTGLQRAVALAIIQVAATTNKTAGLPDLFLGLDEPETWLHPRAQVALAMAIREIGADQQVWVATHSPYMLRRFDHDIDSLFILDHPSPNPDEYHRERITSSADLKPLASKYPSLAQITYTAFQIPTAEYHSEVYGALHRTIQDRECKSGDHLSLKKFDELIDPNRKLSIYQRYNNQKKGYSLLTLPTYVRNSIDHPESVDPDPNRVVPSGCTSPVVDDRLIGESIEMLTQLLHCWRTKA